MKGRNKLQEHMEIYLIRFDSHRVLVNHNGINGEE